MRFSVWNVLVFQKNSFIVFEKEVQIRLNSSYEPIRSNQGKEDKTVLYQASCYLILFSNYATFCWNGSVIFTIVDKFKQCACIRFCVKLGKSNTDIIEMQR